MSMSNDLLTQVLGLPEQERAALIRQALLSLQPNDFDGDAEKAWDKELEARLAATEDGKFTAREWRESLARIRQSLSQENLP